jgi:hypothetical protein
MTSSCLQNLAGTSRLCRCRYGQMPYVSQECYGHLYSPLPPVVERSADHKSPLSGAGYTAHSLRGRLIESRSYYPTTKDLGQAQSNLGTVLIRRPRTLPPFALEPELGHHPTLAVRSLQRTVSKQPQRSRRITVDATSQALYNAGNSLAVCCSYPSSQITEHTDECSSHPSILEPPTITWLLCARPLPPEAPTPHPHLIFPDGGSAPERTIEDIRLKEP